MRLLKDLNEVVHIEDTDMWYCATLCEGPWDGWEEMLGCLISVTGITVVTCMSCLAESFHKEYNV